MNLVQHIRNAFWAIRLAARPLFNGFVLGAMLLPVSLYAIVAWQDRVIVIQQAEQRASSVIAILDENAKNVFDTHKLLASLVNEHIRGMSWSEIADSEALHNYLAEVVSNDPKVLSLWLIDSSGLIRNTSAAFPVPSVKVTDRDYFIALSQHDTGMFIGQRVQGRVFRDQDVFNVAQRRLTSSKDFDGVIVVSASTSYFTNFWKQVADEPDVAAIAIRKEGAILARLPANDTSALTARSPLIQAIAKSDSGHYRAFSTIDGIERFYAYRKVVGYPVYVDYGISVGGALREWHRHLATYGLFFAPGTLVLVWLAFTVVRRTSEIGLLNVSLGQRASALEVANRELEGLSYSTSHVLRAPLRAIDGYSHILLQEHSAELDSEGKRLIGVLQLSAHELNDQIDGILEFLQLGRSRLSRNEVDMAATVQMVLQELEPKTRGRNLIIELSPLPSAFGDAAMIQRVWMNLLDNAVKFTAPKADAKIEVGELSKEGEAVYYVRDNGVGFDMQFAGKLFGVFDRLHGADFPGNGTGLAIVQRIISRHGGRVWADGKPDEGATFYFTLPASETGHD